MRPLLYTLITVSPGLVFAAAAPADFKSFVAIVMGLIRILIIFVFALTFLTLMWSLIKNWIIGGGEAEGIESGKKVVFAGIIALVVMCSIWGILYLLQRSIFG